MGELGRCAVVGAGRVAKALVAALPGVDGPFGRGFDGRTLDGRTYDIVILAVPDGEIGAAARAVSPGPLVGHCAGALGVAVLAPHEAFGLHPLMTIATVPAPFAGGSVAVAGSTPRAVAVAHDLAARLGMRTFEIADEHRAAYHAAASIASNFLVTLEDAAEAVLATTGVSREILGPLARATLENWLSLGGPEALTGPIARGDEATVVRQRAAVADRAPELLAMFDALADRTRSLAGRLRT